MEAPERQVGGGAHTAAGLWSCAWGRQAGSSCTPPPPSPGTAAGSAACCAGPAATPGCGWSVAAGERLEVRGQHGQDAEKGWARSTPSLEGPTETSSWSHTGVRGRERWHSSVHSGEMLQTARGALGGQINQAVHTKEYTQLFARTRQQDPSADREQPPTSAAQLGAGGGVKA